MAAEVLQILEYRGGQLNVALVPEEKKEERVLVTNSLTHGGLLRRRVAQEASCSRGELLYTKQRVAYQRFAYQRFEQKDNGEKILEVINEGTISYGNRLDVSTRGLSVQYNKVPLRARVLNDLSAEEKAKVIKLTFVQPISYSRYTKRPYTHSFNHYTDAKYIWENMKMILEGYELTKDDRESQLYDEFEHFRQIKGETIQGYYVRFIEASINDQRKNIKMTWPRSPSTNNDPLALVTIASGSADSSSPEHLIESLSKSLALTLNRTNPSSSKPKQQIRTHLMQEQQLSGSRDARVVVQDVRGRYNANNQGRPF
ncbi:hypothetical protein Tco_0092810 [Tanacetum coccineum]